MSETHAYKVGQTVDAFHPGMFGVVKTGAVVKVGRKYLRVDFGPCWAVRGGFTRTTSTLRQTHARTRRQPFPHGWG